MTTQKLQEGRKQNQRTKTTKERNSGNLSQKNKEQVTWITLTRTRKEELKLRGTQGASRGMDPNYRRFRMLTENAS